MIRFGLVAGWSSSMVAFDFDHRNLIKSLVVGHFYIFRFRLRIGFNAAILSISPAEFIFSPKTIGRRPSVTVLVYPR